MLKIDLGGRVLTYEKDTYDKLNNQGHSEGRGYTAREVFRIIDATDE